MSAIETIREWLENGDALPEESDLFFKKWVMVNACYNEWYTIEDGRDKEWEYCFARDTKGSLSQRSSLLQQSFALIKKTRQNIHV